MYPDEMQEEKFLTRFRKTFAIGLAVTLFLPGSALGLRPAGLEESTAKPDLVSRLQTSTGLEELTNEVVQAALVILRSFRFHNGKWAVLISRLSPSVQKALIQHPVSTISKHREEWLRAKLLRKKDLGNLKADIKKAIAQTQRLIAEQTLTRPEIRLETGTGSVTVSGDLSPTMSQARNAGAVPVKEQQGTQAPDIEVRHVSSADREKLIQATQIRELSSYGWFEKRALAKKTTSIAKAVGQQVWEAEFQKPIYTLLIALRLLDESIPRGLLRPPDILMQELVLEAGRLSLEQFRVVVSLTLRVVGLGVDPSRLFSLVDEISRRSREASDPAAASSQILAVLGERVDLAIQRGTPLSFLRSDLTSLLKAQAPQPPVQPPAAGPVPLPAGSLENTVIWAFGPHGSSELKGLGSLLDPILQRASGKVVYCAEKGPIRLLNVWNDESFPVQARRVDLLLRLLDIIQGKEKSKDEEEAALAAEVERKVLALQQQEDEATDTLLAMAYQTPQHIFHSPQVSKLLSAFFPHLSYIAEHPNVIVEFERTSSKGSFNAVRMDLLEKAAGIAFVRSDPTGTSHFENALLSYYLALERFMTEDRDTDYAENQLPPIIRRYAGATVVVQRGTRHRKLAERVSHEQLGVQKWVLPIPEEAPSPMHRLLDPYRDSILQGASVSTLPASMREELLSHFPWDAVSISLQTGDRLSTISSKKIADEVMDRVKRDGHLLSLKQANEAAVGIGYLDLNLLDKEHPKRWRDDFRVLNIALLMLNGYLTNEQLGLMDPKLVAVARGHANRLVQSGIGKFRAGAEEIMTELAPEELLRPFSQQKWAISDLDGVPTRNRLFEAGWDDPLPEVPLPKNRVVYLQPDLVPEVMEIALIRLGYGIEPLTEQAFLNLAERYRQPAEGLPPVLVIAEPDQIDRLKKEVSWEVPLILLGIPKGIIPPTMHPNSLASYLLDLVAEAQRLGLLVVERLEATAGVEEQRKTLFLASRA
ncbi:MAG: hypothetical protein HYZ90_07210 [Candidatus Omnitrophica bacterium]|nr:hypothetical protein [Candidatus Omnitrophota bacterium]